MLLLFLSAPADLEAVSATEAAVAVLMKFLLVSIGVEYCVAWQLLANFQIHV